MGTWSLSVLPLCSVWPIQHLWALLWYLPSYLDSEIRAGFGTQRVWSPKGERNFAKYRVARFQKSLLPLKGCIASAWTTKATQSPCCLDLVIKLRKPSCPTLCDGVHLQIVIPSKTKSKSKMLALKLFVVLLSGLNPWSNLPLYVLWFLLGPRHVDQS